MDDKFEHHFTQDFPLIYKNKITKNDTKNYYFRSALDNALKYNQIRAATLIIEYIRKYQNSFVSSYLFKKNLGPLL